MKKLFVLTLIVGYCLNGIASKPSKSWALLNEGKIDIQKVNIEAGKAKIVLQNGEKKIIPIDQLNSYSVDDKVFNKVPLYRNGVPTGKMVFMELVKTRGDYSLYKYEYFDNDLIKEDKTVKTAYLFNNDKFLMQVDEKTLPNVCNFFGLTASIE